MDDKLLGIIDKLDGISATALGEALKMIQVKIIMLWVVGIFAVATWLWVFVAGCISFRKDQTPQGYGAIIMIISFFFFLIALLCAWQIFAYEIAPNTSAIRYLLNG